MGLSHSPRIVTNGLVLCLDAGNTRSYPGSGTTWTDLSGNGNNGTMSNVTYTGGAGAYMTFNGTNSLVDCGTNNVLYCGSSMTIDAIIYTVGFGGINLGRIVDRSAASTIGYQFQVDGTGTSGTNGLRYTVNNAVEGTSADSIDNVISLNTWQHVSVTQSGSTVTMYNNGSSVGVSPLSYPTPTSGTTNFYIGNRSDLNRCFNGRIALVRVYNRALSAAEISQNFNATRGRYGI